MAPNLGPRRDPGPIPPVERAKLDAQRAAAKRPEAAGVKGVEVVHRRAPRYGRFILTGLLAGALLAFVIALATRGWSALSTSNTFWLLLISLGLLGMLAGSVVAYLRDRASLTHVDAMVASPDEPEGRA